HSRLQPVTADAISYGVNISGKAPGEIPATRPGKSHTTLCRAAHCELGIRERGRTALTVRNRIGRWRRGIFENFGRARDVVGRFFLLKFRNRFSLRGNFLWFRLWFGFVKTLTFIHAAAFG